MKKQRLITTLYDCVAHCNHCADACLDEEEVKKMVKCIRLGRTCAAICSTVAVALSNGSKEIHDLLKICKQICEECATECRKHDASHCQDCAEACEKCAAACISFQ